MFWKCFKRPKVTHLSKTIDSLKSLNMERFEYVYSSDMYIREISTYCSNIIDYNKLLKYLINHLSDNSLLYVNNIPQEIKQLPLPLWFLDHDNRYIQVNKVLSEFITLCIEFITIFDTIERQDKDFNKEKNLLLTQHILNNIITITNSLLSV